MVLKKTRSLLMAATLALLAGCSFSSGLELHNLTGHTLTPYPVVVSPPPPHREADPSGAVLQGGKTSIDPASFNPLFYTPGVADPTLANAVFLGLDLVDADPLQIQYRVFHYKVPPGQEGSDPALQPLLLHEGIEDVADADLTITVSVPTDLSNPPPGGWNVEFVSKP